MSVALHTPPILRLSVDVFMYIVNINANMFHNDEDALDTTRLTSQVCRSWRNVILNNESLWGHMINIDRLEHLSSTHWAKEIIRRSGMKSNLWIKGEENWMRRHQPCYEQSAIFFSGIVEEYWDRIERLILRGPVLDAIDRSNGALYRPAPNLKMFHVHFCDQSIKLDSTTDTSHSSMRLFSGHAPLLRYFRTECHKINFHPSWLRHLEFINFGQIYDIGDCLTVLSSTPNLHNLEITSTSEELPPISSVTVPLSKLKKLKLRLSFDKMAFMLDHLEILDECSLDLYASGYGSTAVTFLEISSTLSTAYQHYFKSHSPRTINIACLGWKYIAMSEDLGENCWDKNCLFKIVCGESFVSLGDINELSIISKAFSLEEFATVTELKLWYDIRHPEEPHLSFLQCFKSVEVLHCNEQLFYLLVTTYKHLPNSESSQNVLLPRLRRIVLQSGTIYFSEFGTLGDYTIKFILSRIKIGAPISVLDLTQCKEYEVDRSVIDRLAGIGGLEIVLPERWVARSIGSRRQYISYTKPRRNGSRK